MVRAESAYPAVLALVLLLTVSVRDTPAQSPTASSQAPSSPPSSVRAPSSPQQSSNARSAGSQDVVSQEIEVNLAEVEVMVTDRQGEPVVGLGREDFELLQDGQAVELTHFRAVSGGVDATSIEASPAMAAGPDAELVERLNLVVYIDRSYLELGDLNDVREALKGFLRQALRPGDRTMLVSAAGSVQVLQRFTTLPELVTAKLDRIRERPGGSRFAKEYQNLLVDIRRLMSEGNDLDARDPRLLADGFFSQVQAFAAEVEGELQRSTGQLKQLILTIAGLPGRRAVLYVGGRVPAAYSRSLFEAWDEAFGRNSNLSIPNRPGAGVGGGQSTDTSDQLVDDKLAFNSLAAASAGAQVDNQRLVQEVAQLASGHGVVFHTLDAGSLRGSASTFSAPGEASVASRGASGRPGPTLVPGSLADGLSSLRDLASGTGGRSFTGSRNFADALARIGSDLETFYSLGFVPRPASHEISKIEVRLRSAKRADGDRGKLKVRHRSRLRVKDRDTLAAERTVAALLLEETDNPLRIALDAGEATEAGKDGLRVPVSVSLPLASLALVADGRVHTGRLSIFAASGGLDRVGSVVKAVVPVRIANRDLLTSLGRRVAYELELTLPTDQHRIAVTVRDDFRPQSSTAMTSLLAGGLPGAESPRPARGRE